MAYDGKVMRMALMRFEEDRQKRQEQNRMKRESVFARQPRLRQIDAELRSTASRIIAQALRQGTDPRPAIERLKEENLELQDEKRRLLRQMGLAPDYLEEKPGCALCGDTGYQGGRVCACLREYYAKEQQQELSRMLDLGNQSFDTFRLEWYSDRIEPGRSSSPQENMKAVYDICAEYGHHFGKKPGNLLLFGAPGLGKTHLSAAIAREVSAKGYSVVYDTAIHVFERFESRKFDQEDEAQSDVERILNCDLLILDDLGTEMRSTFIQSALYQIINTRLIEKRSTILNTNLNPGELSQRYSPQTASRIEGEYQILPFFGEDIRGLKKSRRLPPVR